MMVNPRKFHLSVKTAVYVLPALLCSYVSVANAGASEMLLNEYKSQTGTEFSAGKGAELWNTVYRNNKNAQQRSCASCHSKNIRLTGKHVKTNKEIKPLAPSVNPQRLTKRKTIEKWFRRNCKWTMNRECTLEEKGHLLKYIQSQ